MISRTLARALARLSLAGAAAVLVVGAKPARAQPVAAAPEALAVGDFQLWPSVEVRTRGEYRGSPVDVGSAVAWPAKTLAFGERARVGLGVDHGALRAQITLQDARAWGAQPGDATLAGAGARFVTFGAYEAYLEARTSAPRPSFVRVGRQAVAWGEGLLVGAADWSPTGRALDAIRARYVSGNGEAELLGAILETPRPLGASYGDRGGSFRLGVPLVGARASYAVDPLLRLEVVALARVARADDGAPVSPSRFVAARDDGETYTGSLRVSGERGPFDYGVEAAGQVGRAPFLAEKRRAYAAAGHAGLRLDRVAWTPALLAGLSYASGDKGSGAYGQFDPGLPDVHGPLGPMDLFALSNVLEARGRVVLAPADPLRLVLEYRYARLADRRGEWLDAYVQSIGSVPTGAASLDLGHELDASVRWSPATIFDLEGGYGALLLGSGARSIMAREGLGHATSTATATGPVDAPHASHFAYVQATLRMP